MKPCVKSLMLAVLLVGTWSFTSPAADAPPKPVPVAAPKTNPAATVKPSGEWVLLDERAFDGRKSHTTYHPYYVIEANEVGVHDKDAVIEWHHYNDEPTITYRPAQELLLDSSRVLDRWVRLTKQIPHTVKWEVEFTGGAGAANVQLDGVVIGVNTPGTGVPANPAQVTKMVIQRSGKVLSVQVGAAPAKTLAVEADDRTPLRIVAQIRPVLLRSTKLYLGNGEKLSPAPAPKANAKPQWEKVFSSDFSKEDDLKAFVTHPEACPLTWNKTEKALSVDPRGKSGSDDCYVILHKSLPGDMRINFRARSTLEKQPAFFGLLVNLGGALKKEDGYFVEWNYWQVQIKKQNARMEGKSVGYKNRKATEWMKFSLEKVGGEFTMFTDGVEVLKWTDPHPYKDSHHDLLTFYSWKVPMEFTDIVIERNKLDTIPPAADDPAMPENYKKGERGTSPQDGTVMDF